MESSGVAKSLLDGGGLWIRLRMQRQRETVQALQCSAKEKVMLSGSLVAQQVTQLAALENERAKMASLTLKTATFGASCVRVGGEVERQDASTQTNNGELVRLQRDRDGLLAATRNMPKNTVTMVTIFQRRNDMMLAREERSLQQARACRRAKEQRLQDLQARRTQQMEEQMAQEMAQQMAQEDDWL